MDVLVISSYPEKDQIHGEKTVGVGYYTKATLLALLKANPNLKFTVWAEIFDKKDSYWENSIKVERCWRRASLASLAALFLGAVKNKTRVVILPFEMFMYGKFPHVALALVMMLILKLSGKRLVLVVHQVLGGSLSAFEKNPVKAGFFSLLRKLFYAYLLFVSYRLVVFEEEFKSRLGGGKKLRVIPLAVTQETHIDKAVAREALGLNKDRRYVLYFGFLSPYKGVIELLDIWERAEGVELIIGGGGNPNHLGEESYRNFVDLTMKKAKEKGALVTGFVPEEQMLNYFCGADLLILPYTVFMSSSGPLAIAYSQGMGVLFSNALRGYFQSADMKSALDEAGLQVEDICFDLQKPVKEKIMWAMQNLDRLNKFSAIMGQVRSWDKLSHDYDQVLKEADE